MGERTPPLFQTVKAMNAIDVTEYFAAHYEGHAQAAELEKARDEDEIQMAHANRGGNGH